ncbi:MAG: hypothetical protein WDM79_02000 [Terricaulis sp.]
MAITGPDSRKIAALATRDTFTREGCSFVRVGETGHKYDAFVAPGQISLVVCPGFRLAYGKIQLSAFLSFVDQEFERLGDREPLTQETFGVFGAYSANFAELRRSDWIERENLTDDLARALEPYIAIVRAYPRERQAFRSAVASGAICGLPSRYFLAGAILAERRLEFQKWLGLESMATGS